MTERRLGDVALLKGGRGFSIGHRSPDGHPKEDPDGIPIGLRRRPPEGGDPYLGVRFRYGLGYGFVRTWDRTWVRFRYGFGTVSVRLFPYLGVRFRYGLGTVWLRFGYGLAEVWLRSMCGS